MRVNTIIEIAKILDMNIDGLEVESINHGQDGYILSDGEKNYRIEFILTNTEYISAFASPDGEAKLHRAGSIENIYDPKDRYDLLTFFMTYKLI